MALYGNRMMAKGRCESCDCTAFIVDGKLTCCKSPVKPSTGTSHRESTTEMRRKKPSLATQNRILDNQFQRCIYCGLRFDATVQYVGKNKSKRASLKVITLRVTWDHLVPYTYTANNRDENFVAACQVCNAIKGAKLFYSIDEAIDYVRKRWHAKGCRSVEFAGVAVNPFSVRVARKAVATNG